MSSGPGPLRTVVPTSQPQFPTTQAQTQTQFTPPSVISSVTPKQALTPSSVAQGPTSTSTAGAEDTADRTLYSPGVIDLLYADTNDATEALQLQHAQQLAGALEPMLELGSRVVVNPALFKLHLDLVGMRMGPEDRPPDPQNIELLQWLQISNPQSNRVAVMDTKTANRLVWHLFERTFPQLSNYPRRELSHEELLAAATYIVRDPTNVLLPRTEQAASSSQAASAFPLHLFSNFMPLLPALQAVMQQSQAQVKASGTSPPKPDPQAAIRNLSQVSNISATAAPESSAASTTVDSRST